MNQESYLFLLLSFVSLFGLFFVSTFLNSVRRYRKQAQAYFSEASSFYFKLHKFFFGDKIDTLLFCLTCVQNTLRVLFLLFIYTSFFSNQAMNTYILHDAWLDFASGLKFIVFLLLLIIFFIVVADLLPKVWVFYGKKSSLQIGGRVALIFLTLFFPISLLLYRIIRLASPQATFSPLGEAELSSKEKLLELIKDVDDGNLLNEHDKKLIYAVLNYRDRIAREVMVPRVDLFCIPHDTSIKKAAELLEEQGYSRVPVYKDSIDEVTGYLMYKDILVKYMEQRSMPNALDEPVETITKHVIFIPETKKLSQLLQEFRKKQMHMAIVVDEYGGTAGIVTIEDILEEIVGEIADEYDEESQIFRPAGKNSFIIDAKMNLLDLEEELSIRIPQEGDYDTIAGYIFYRLGTIPEKGTIIHQDDFDLEILVSDDRSVDKVKITATKNRPFTKEQNL